MKKLIDWSKFEININKKIGGIVGVELEQDQVVLLHIISGKNPPAGLLYPILRAALPDDVWGEAERQHRSRVHPWRVDRRIGMSGARDYVLRYLVDENWGVMRRGGSVHVSMHGEINHGVRIPLMDLTPLLAVIMRDFPPVAAEIRILQPASAGDFRPAGEPSGLQEVLEALRVLHTLEEVQQ